MSIRVGINGAGRIGRTFWRASRELPGIEVVAVNDPAPPRTLAYLMRYDSVRGRLTAEVTAGDDTIRLDDRAVAVYGQTEVGAVPWGEHDVDVVIDATGRFLSPDQLRGHLRAGARRVLVSTATVDPDVTVLMGLTDDRFDPDAHRIVSPGCCTSSAVAPAIAVIRDLAGLTGGVLTTAHAYDSTKSSLVDSAHDDPRLGRAAGLNLVPAPLKPGSRAAITGAFPELVDRFTGLHVRVPLAVGCLASLVLTVDRPTTATEVNDALMQAAQGRLKGVLGYTTEPVVSSDLIGSSESLIVDASLTTAVGDTVTVAGWYDNEWGYAHRMADVAMLIGAAGRTRQAERSRDRTAGCRPRR